MFKRLGVLTDEVSPNLIEALDWAKEAGLAHVEIRTVDRINVMDLPDDKLKWIRGETEKRALFISAIASPLFKCSLNPLRPVIKGDTFGQTEEDLKAHFLKLDRVIRIAEILGTNHIRIFSFWREIHPEVCFDEIVEHLRKAADIAGANGVVLLLENEPSCNGGFASEVASIVSKVNSPALRVLWDPGNEEYGGKNAFPEGFTHVRKVIAHVHLKDAFIDGDGVSRCVPLGKGNVQFRPFFHALREEGYDGLFTIETHYVPEGGTAKDGTQLSLNGLLQILGEGEFEL